MIFRFVFFLLLLPHLAFGATATATLTINVASSTTLPSSTYVLTGGPTNLPVDAVDATANPPTAPAITYLAPQQWIWDGTRLDSVLRKGSGTEFLADGNSGLPIMNSTGDTWTTVPISSAGRTVGWTFQNARTGNYLTIATGTSILSMLSSGTQTPTTWVPASGAAIAPTTIPLTTGTTGTVATFTCLLGSIMQQPCDTTQTWSASGALPVWVTLNASTGVLTTNSTPIVGSYTFTVMEGVYGPQTVSLTVTTSATLASGTYEFSSGGQAINSGNSTTPIAYPNTPGAAQQQWIWNGSTINSVRNYPTFPSYISDGGSGLPLLTGGPGASWTLAASGSGWTMRAASSNYLTIQTGTGTLSMIPSGTQTPTVWTATLVTAPPPQPSATLSASPTSVTPGNSSTLTWSSTNAGSCSGTNFSTGGTTAGSTSVTPAATTTYSINCAGASATATVTVSSSITATLTASPISVASGGSSTLTWSSTNALTCAGTNFSTGGATSGSVSTGALTATTNYSINCSGATASATVTVQTGGAGACPGGDSGFVPAGYNCVLSSTDEFNGSSIDTSKWFISGSPGGQGPGTGLVEGGGVVTVQAIPMGPPSTFFNGSTSGGLQSIFPIPDAPMYLEFARTLSPPVVALFQFWSTTCGLANASGFVTSCTTGELDIDMGPFDGCNQDNIYPGANIYGLCCGMFDWNNNGAGGFFNGGAAGPEPVDGDTAYHIIGMQLLPDPAPNGTVIYSVDGVPVKTLTNMPDDRWINGSHWIPPGSNRRLMELDLFCTNGNGCSYPMSVQWDYLRVYTPSGLPNGY